MTRSRRRAAVGLGAAAVYVGLGLVSAHLSPLARAPLLDGLAPPPPYRWVEPPPELASGNEQPAPGSFDVRLGPNGSRPGLFTTPDSQVSVFLDPGAIPTAPGATGLRLTIEPLAPAEDAAPPEGISIRGNVYRVALRYVGGGGSVTELRRRASIALQYPAEAGHVGRVVLFSPDGRTFSELQTVDSPIQLKVSARITRVGFFAVGRLGGGTESGSSVPAITWIVAGLALALAVGVALWRWHATRKNPRPPSGARPSRAKKRPPGGR